MSKLDSHWKILHQHAESLDGTSLRELFADDPNRASSFSLEAQGLLLDYAKQRVSQTAIDALLALATAAEIENKRDSMFSGEPYNNTEGRAVLHTALRDPNIGDARVSGAKTGELVHAELIKLRQFAEDVRSGRYTASNGAAFTDVVNIGIGGSDLGPVMVTEALKPYSIKGRRSFYVSNVDGTHLAETLGQIDPERT
ncbi:MAG: glucose-6-phosphate isomerase, partial [Granulosicoccaceae bacterium]